MEIKRFNILIGEQASGKSLLAKLVYFFRNIANLSKTNIKDERSIDDFKETLRKEFTSYFPTVYWEEQGEFEIEYCFGNLKFIVLYDLNSKSRCNITFNDNFINFYKKLLERTLVIRNKVKIELENIQENIDFFDEDLKISELISEAINESGYSEFFGSSVYIPSSRSFFSTLDKNIWTLTDQNVIDIDPFMSRFGRAFEQSKRLYNLFREEDNRFIKSVMPDTYKDYDFLKNILKGDYEEIDNKGWIIGDNYKVNLSRASSGQQEALPLLIVLLTSVIFPSRHNNYFLEEPEAHLFPDAQNEMISFLLMIFSERNASLFITTHSPYVLTAINNAILANEMILKNKLSKEDFIKLSNGAHPISYDEISAFAMNDGNLKSIKNDDFKMIGSEIIDSVSDVFQDVMNKLLMLDV